MDPHCISGGHTLSQCHHGSAVYLLAAILWVTYSPSIGIPTSILEYILTLFDGCLQLLPSSLTSHPCFEESTKCFSQQLSFSDLTLWGAVCYTSKFLTSIMSHSHFCKCHTFVTSVVNVTFPFFICHIVNDTMETLDTSSRTCWKEKPHHLTS